MMDLGIRIFLLLYFIIYFGLAFVVKSYQVKKEIGKNPNVLPRDDSAYGLIGSYFRIMMISMFLYIILLASISNFDLLLLPIFSLEYSNIRYIGIGLLLLSLIWTIIAQNDMKTSWRIGIDTETKTDLITTGLFHYSRNPIFFGMILSLIGLFFVTPNAATLIFLILGYVLIQIQIRLEEEFLTNQYGQEYLDYKNKVRRFI